MLLRNVSDAMGTLVRDINAQGDGDRLLISIRFSIGLRCTTAALAEI